ncbi:anthrone oxygenase family protein [Baekduia sp. Peel2402]|uniref:anthrone oxygenase family protein n=1 Tax=Baekduia sp. Peel2402 TaxID=3458296 RepID=UPI00403EE6D5
MRSAATLAGALGAGLVGGTFFAFSSFVMPALERLPATDAIKAMQSINVTAERPAFMVAFMGTTLVAAYLAVRGVMDWGDRRATLLVAGSAVFLVGSFLLTVAHNVPLNNELADVSPHAANAAARWQEYLDGWNWANHVRGAASIGAAAAWVGALLSTP